MKGKLRRGDGLQDPQEALTSGNEGSGWCSVAALGTTLSIGSWGTDRVENGPWAVYLFWQV